MGEFSRGRGLTTSKFTPLLLFVILQPHKATFCFKKMVWLIVNAVRYVWKKVRGTDEDSKESLANQKCVLAGDKQAKEKDAAFSDMDKAPLSNDSSVAKKECTPSGGWG